MKNPVVEWQNKVQKNCKYLQWQNGELRTKRAKCKQQDMISCTYNHCIYANKINTY